MKTKGSLSCSKKPIIGPYPESHETSPHLVYLRSILILFSQVLGLSSGLFRSGIPTNNLYTFVTFHVCYMTCSSLIWSL